MSKHIFKAFVLAACVLPVVSSCELDQYPETELVTEESFVYTSDAENYYVGLLSCIRSVSNGSGPYSEVQADLFNLVWKAAYYTQLHDWTFTQSSFDGDGVWEGNYYVIANANNIINNIDQIETSDEDELARLAYIKGTAYFARAYSYSNMVTRYCQEYDTSTATSQLGLPLIYEVDVDYKPSRSSLAETYEQIFSDLELAEELMNDPENTDYTAPNYNTCRALEARMALASKDYDRAIECVDDVLERYSLYTSKTDYAAIWETDYADAATELIFEPVLTTDERTAFFWIYIDYNESSEAYSPCYMPTQGAIDLYTRGDYRKSIFFTTVSLIAGDVTASGYMLTKFPGNSDLKVSSEYEYYNMTKPFRTAELYLIAAEASYMLNGTEGGYLYELQNARSARVTESTGNTLFTDIKNEWAREFIGEGYRLDCLKRWGEGFTRLEAQTLTAGFLDETTGYKDLSIDADNYRWVWEIPTNDLQANTNLERNWTTE